MARKALVGCTGFVGTSLQRQTRFDGLFHSRNIAEIAGQDFDLVICAAAPATMWAANQDPEADKANLDALASHLSRVKARRFVLISTIAVMDDAGAGYTESTARFESDKAYGRHRHALEERMLGQFEQCHVLRLPALFGPGLKKNFLFDLLNPLPSFIKPERFAELAESFGAAERAALGAWYSLDPALGMHGLDRAGLSQSADADMLAGAFAAAGFLARDFTNSASRFQYYNIDRLSGDIGRAVEAGVTVLNVCSQPLEARAIALALTGEAFDNPGPPVTCEDMRSDHAALFGAAGPYLIDGDAVLADLKVFFAAEQARRLGRAQ